MVLILNNAEIDSILEMKECIEILEKAYTEQAHDRAVNALRKDTRVPLSSNGEEKRDYEFKTMVGVIPAFGVAAIRLSSIIERWTESDRNLVPASAGGRYVGLVQLYSLSTCEPLAIFPDGIISRKRVGATYGLATKYVSRRDTTTMGLFGAGNQSVAQVEAHCAVRDITQIRLFSPTRSRRDEFIRTMSRKVGVDIVGVEEPARAMKGCDLVVASTNSTQPVLRGEWVEDGMHCASMKGEVDQSFLNRVDILVMNSMIRYETWYMGGGQYGTLRKDIDFTNFGKVDRSRGILLQDVVAGKSSRTTPSQVSYLDSGSGIGLQFAALGHLLYKKAKEAGLGREVNTEWFTQLEFT